MKGFVLFVANSSSKTNNEFLLLIASFTALNLTECMLIMQFDIGTASNMVIRSYYVFSIVSVVLMCRYTASVINSAIYKMISTSLSIVAVGLVLLVLVSDLIVAGSAPSGHVYMAIRGDGYWLYHLFTSSVFISVILVLGFSFSKTQEKVLKTQIKYLLIATLPIVLTGLSISILMANGFNINAAALVPVATTAFLIIALIGERQHRRTNIRMYLPFSEERQFSHEMLEIADQYSMHDICLSDARDEIEKQLILFTLKKASGNVSRAAELMSINRGTLYTRMKSLGISKSDR